ncbi:MAG: protein-disulfide reductase DsbD family protein [Desulfovibrio sp.]
MTQKRIVSALLLLLVLGAALPAEAQFQAADEPFDISFQAFALSPTPEVSPNETILVVLTLTPRDGWYAYAADHPGPVGRPPVIKAEAMPGGEAVVPYFPPGTDKPNPFDPTRTMRVYAGATPLFLPLPPGLAAPARLKMRLGLALCLENKCRETSVELVYPLKTTDPAALQRAEDQPWWPDFQAAVRLGPQLPGRQTSPGYQPAFTPAQTTPEGWNFQPREAAPELAVTGLLTALLFGLLAGLILNVMPCVLPVVSLKLSGLLAGGGLAASEKRRAFREHNIFFSLGILSWFAFLAVLLAATGMAWGEIFQAPLLVALLAAMVLAMSLSLFGVFNLPVIDLKLDAKAKNPAAQAYFTGVLATLLATPCSGPFLGGVLGWALLRPTYEVALVFLSVGLGMSLPYLGMAALPGLARHFPRPGVWTGYVERAAGFFLLATAAYLVNILPESYLARTLTLLWITALACWLWGLAGPEASDRKRLVLRSATLVLALGALLWLLLPRGAGFAWEEFRTDRLRDRLGQELLVADFTADWCPTCKFLEQTVLTDQNVRDWAARHGAVFVRVDLTDDNLGAEDLLRALGSRSIPLLAVFPKGDTAKRPIVLRDLFSARQVEAALEQAKKQAR